MSELKRSLGLVECTLMGVGVILGAGIYALVGSAAVQAGNAVWVSFLAAAVVAGFTGLSYAELSSFIPKAGGEYYYAQRAFGHFVAFLVTWLLLVGLAIASAAVALGFAGYFHAIFGTGIVLTACMLIAITAVLLVYGIKQSAWVAGFCTLLELAGLLVIIAVGLPRLGAVDYLETSEAGIGGVMAAASLIFFAYIGFEEIVQLSEETKNPTRNIPLAVLLSILITTVIYVLVAMCAVSVLGWRELGASSAPLADVAAMSLGREVFFVLSVIALFSTGNTVLILVLSSARLLYGMAEDGSLPRGLARIHRTRQTPDLATLTIAMVSMLMVFAFEQIEIVANLTNFALLSTFAIINGAVVVLRYREPEAARRFTVPGRFGRLPLLPVLGILSSLIMLLYVGRTAAIAGTVLLVSGAVVYRLNHAPQRGTESESQLHEER